MGTTTTNPSSPKKEDEEEKKKQKPCSTNAIARNFLYQYAGRSQNVKKILLDFWSINKQLHYLNFTNSNQANHIVVFYHEFEHFIGKMSLKILIKINTTMQIFNY